MGRISVLVADDDSEVREALLDFLSTDPGLQIVGAARDADEAIGLAMEHKIDVVLLDVRMAAGGGPRAARQILKFQPECKIIALSAFHDLSTVLEMLRAGAVGYLVKGVSPEKIPEAIAFAAKGEPILSRKVTLDVITELVRLLDKSEELVEGLADLDRVKSELVQVLSHELRTPVAILRGSSSVLVQLTDDQSVRQRKELADSIARASDRIARLASNASATASLDRRDIEVVTRPLKVGELISTARLEFPKDKERLRLVDDDPVLDEVIWADKGLAVRPLVIVIENALDLSPEDQLVEIRVEIVETTVTILVEDRGRGIPENERERVFDLFTQADSSSSRDHGGLGIGLYLARRIMEAHHGTATTAPRQGGGSTFSLSFPRLRSDGLDSSQGSHG